MSGPPIVWLTNMDHRKRHEPLPLFMRYHKDLYPAYDNYDAIEVSRVNNIPEDYPGVMGVPISYLMKHCPEQFEIVDRTGRHLDNPVKTRTYMKGDYKNYSDMNKQGVIIDNDKVKMVYDRILIRNRMLQAQPTQQRIPVIDQTVSAAA